MKNINIPGILFFLLTLCAAGAALLLVVVLSRDAWRALHASDPNVVAAILFGYGALTLVLVVLVSLRASERRFVLLRERRERRAKIYEELIRAIYTFNYAKIIGERVNRKAALKQLFAVQQNLILCGSEQVLQCLIDFWDVIGWPREEDEGDTSLVLADLLAAMRQDLGQSSFSIEDDDLVRLFAPEDLVYADTARIGADRE